MKIYCGTDIIETERIKESIEKQGKTFLERVYTKKEIEYCENKKAQKYQHYAARFAAKEATFKAISKIVDKYSVTWTDIEITNQEDGRPLVNILSKDIKNIESMDITLSHIKDYATATAVILLKD